MRALTTFWTTVAVAGLAAVPVLGVTAAQADTSPSPSAPAAVRLTRACDRLPRRIARLERVQTRFHADVSTRGSIAFLTARISRADADGKADLARVLRDRLAVRNDLDGQLPDVLAKLKDAEQVCAAHGSSAAAPSATATS